MPGTVILREEVVRELMIDVMLGLWNDGFRKQIYVNNHGHLWMLESAIQEFLKRYQLPGIFRVIDWHRAVREFFRTKEQGGEYDTNFVHADEAETLARPATLPRDGGHDEGRRHRAAELPARRPLRHLGGHRTAGPAAGPRARATSPSRSRPPRKAWWARPPTATAKKAKRPLAAILRYLTLLHDEILDAFPAGHGPARGEDDAARSARSWSRTCRSRMSPGWKSVYGLPLVGPR